MTHFVRYDAPDVDARLARAVCGQLVGREDQEPQMPTCPNCLAWLRAYQTLDLYPPAETPARPIERRQRPRHRWVLPLVTEDK